MTTAATAGITAGNFEARNRCNVNSLRKGATFIEAASNSISETTMVLRVQIGPQFSGQRQQSMRCETSADASLCPIAITIRDKNENQ